MRLNPDSKLHLFFGVFRVWPLSHERPLELNDARRWTTTSSMARSAPVRILYGVTSRAGALRLVSSPRRRATRSSVLMWINCETGMDGGHEILSAVPEPPCSVRNAPADCMLPDSFDTEALVSLAAYHRRQPTVHIANRGGQNIGSRLGNELSGLLGSGRFERLCGHSSATASIAVPRGQPRGIRRGRKH